MNITIDNDSVIQLGTWLGAATAGAIAMYLLDPDRGMARRALAADKMQQLGKRGSAALGQVSHDIGASVGSATDSARQLASQAMAGLDGIAERASSTLASTSPPGSTGNMSETARSTMRAYQPGRRDSDTAWGTGTRSAAVAGGGALALMGLMRPRSSLGWLAGLAGMLLLARGAANQPLRKAIPSRSQGRPVELEKTVRIDALPEQVFDLFANYQNFPRFLSNVIEVRDLGDRRSHWEVRGPAGSRFAWNAYLSEHSRPHRLSWHSEPGAEVDNYGSIAFEPVGRSSTRVTVRLSYRPPAGKMGRAIASLFGNEPGQQMADDLKRMKELIERGSLASRSPSMSSQASALH